MRICEKNRAVNLKIYILYFPTVPGTPNGILRDFPLDFTALPFKILSYLFNFVYFSDEQYFFAAINMRIMRAGSPFNKLIKFNYMYLYQYKK